jgi:hypothetical protein
MMETKVSDKYLRALTETLSGSKIADMAAELLDLRRDAAELLQLRAERAKYPRVFKLINKDEYFLVIAKHEPYFQKVYAMIRDQEECQGSWTKEDEEIFLRECPLTSQNHNDAVIDRIYRQLQDAGFHGTLSKMVEQALIASTRWIDIKDIKKCKDRKFYWIVDKGEVHDAYYMDGCFYCVDHSIYRNVTYFMPYFTPALPPREEG